MRILVVDDEQAVRESLERTLRFEGYEVAGDGAEPGGFTKHDFRIDQQAGTVGCPAGHQAPVTASGQASFGTRCTRSLRQRCTTVPVIRAISSATVASSTGANGSAPSRRASSAHSRSATPPNSAGWSEPGSVLIGRHPGRHALPAPVAPAAGRGLGAVAGVAGGLVEFLAPVRPRPPSSATTKTPITAMPSSSAALIG